MGKLNKSEKPNAIVKKLLSEKGISILLFAHDLGMSETQASRIANGWRAPHDPAMRRKIADYLSASEAEIFPNKKIEVSQ